MTHVGYLIAGWTIGLGSIGLYALALMRRGRALAARVPADQRRWITSETGSKAAND